MTYSEVIQGRKNFQSRNNQDYSEKDDANDESSSSSWSDAKAFFKNLNFKKIINIVKKTIHKINTCNDTRSKISCIFEGIFEIFE